MDVYIKGIKMPTDNTVLLRIYPKGNDGVFYVERLDIDDDVLDKYWAVPVPPHGRLIDADVLNDMINRSYPMTDRVDVHNGYGICQEMIKQLPTIIEAEDG